MRQATTTLCKIKLSSGKGPCTPSAKKLTAGTYRCAAAHRGSTNLGGSTSARETITVVK